MDKGWPGHFLDGKSTRCRPVRVRLTQAGLKVSPSRGKSFLWAYSELRLEQGRYAGEPVRLERGEALSQALLLPDSAFLSALLPFLPASRAGKFHDPSTRDRRAWLTLGAGLATVAVALAFHFWVIPSLARTAAEKLPLAWEKKMGASALEFIAPTSMHRRSPALDKVIKAMVARMAATQPKTDYTFEVIVVRNPMVNAFALPGGTILIMSGLLEKTRSPEVLAGVLAHEMQHVLKRHSTRRLFEDSQTGLLLSVFSGDVSGIIMGAQAAHTLASLKYSRDDEREADEAGLRMLSLAGIDPQGMVKAFEMLKESEKIPGKAGKAVEDLSEALKYVSTHPGMDERITALKALAAESTVKVKPIELPQGRKWRSLTASK